MEISSGSERRGGGRGDAALDLAVDDSGNCFVTGGFVETATFNDTSLVSFGGGDIFTAKYETDGNLLWVRQAGGPRTSTSDRGYSVATDGAGNCYVLGDYKGTATFDDTTITDADGKDTFLAKYTGDGELLWVRSARTDPLILIFRSVATDSDGNVYITGGFRNTADFDGHQVTSIGTEDLYVAKYSSDGNVLWGRRAGGGTRAGGGGIATDPDGNCVIGGTFGGTADFGDTVVTSSSIWDVVVAKYDSAGDVLWVRTAGGGPSSYHLAHDVDIDHVGNVVVTGTFADTVSFAGNPLVSSGWADDIFVAKYDLNGDLRWVEKAGGPLSETASGIAIDDTNCVYFTGSFQDSAYFGTHSLYALSTWPRRDIHVAKVGIVVGTGIGSDRPKTVGFVLEQNAPNPFNPVTVIRYRIPTEAHVVMKVYGARGELVRSLVDETKSPNIYRVVWDGRNTGGEEVASGVYFVRLVAGTFSDTKKIVLLR